MRPPICEICHERFMPSDNSGLISFSTTVKDKLWYVKAQTPGFVGHPPNQQWFCEKHYKVAKKYENLSWPEASKNIDNELSKLS